MPIGLSFHVFQSISYLLDVYHRKLKPTRSLLECALCLSFFPQVVAGPIVRVSEFLPQIRGPAVLTREDVDLGLFRILRGLTKKALLADYLGQYVDLVFAMPNAYSGAEVALSIYAYTLQIYLDFSGYSDIAVGLARLLGIRLPENFDSPYRATRVTEFWHRWHMTLSSWLRDYLYIPLGGNRKGRPRRYLNVMLTMLLGGLWHGPSLTFVVWGLLHGVVLAVEKAITPRFKSRSNVAIRAVCGVFTFHLVAALWVVFRASSFSGAETMLSRLTTGWHFGNVRILLGDRSWLCVAILGALVGNLIPSNWVRIVEGLFRRSPWALQAAMLVGIGLAVYEASHANVWPFIYYKF